MPDANPGIGPIRGPNFVVHPRPYHRRAVPHTVKLPRWWCGRRHPMTADTDLSIARSGNARILHPIHSRGWWREWKPVIVRLVLMRFRHATRFPARGRSTLANRGLRCEHAILFSVMTRHVPLVSKPYTLEVDVETLNDVRIARAPHGVGIGIGTCIVRYPCDMLVSPGSLMS